LVAKNGIKYKLGHIPYFLTKDMKKILIFLTKDMKKILIACMLVILLSSTALAAIIDGPANVRDKPKGKVLLKLNNGVRVDVQKKRGEWYWISMRAVVDEGAITDKGGIRKGSTLHLEGGGEMGKVVADVDIKKVVKVVGVIEDRTLEILAWTHKVNIKESAEDGIITDEEQEWFYKIRGDHENSNSFISMSDARKYLRIALKGNHKTIKWYADKKKEYPEYARTSIYSGSMAAAVGSLMPERHIEDYGLIIRVLKEAKEYPDALKAAIIQVGHAKDTSLIPILEGFINHHEPDIRLEAAHSLLKLGEVDTALTVLDEQIKMGKTIALGHVYHTFYGKDWQERGLAQIRKALGYENNEVKALAALFLIHLRNEEVIKDDLKPLGKLLFEICEEIVAKEKWPMSSYGYSDHRALGSIIIAFVELDEKKAIPCLKKIAEHPEASFLDRDAKKAIEKLE
jgi:hypothetical protein